MSTRKHGIHLRANLVAWLLLVLLVSLNWLTTNSSNSTQVIATLAVLACLKFLTIYLVFMETYRAHFMWIAFGIVYPIGMAGLFVVQI